MPWNRKTTRKDRKLRTRRGQTARGRQADNWTRDVLNKYFSGWMRRVADDLLNEWVERITLSPSEYDS